MSQVNLIETFNISHSPPISDNSILYSRSWWLRLSSFRRSICVWLPPLGRYPPQACTKTFKPRLSWTCLKSSWAQAPVPTISRISWKDCRTKFDVLGEFRIKLSFISVFLINCFKIHFYIIWENCFAKKFWSLVLIKLMRKSGIIYNCG